MSGYQRGGDLAAAILTGGEDLPGDPEHLASLLAELAGYYRRLEERLAKIVALSDLYQAEALDAGARLRDALEQLDLVRKAGPVRAGGEAPAPKEARPSARSRDKARDPLVDKLKAALAEPGGYCDPEDVRSLLVRYGKIDSRLDKIVSISDGYQGQLREVSLRLEYMARTDSLTGLPNRRDMVERLEAEHRRLERYSSSRFSLILFDVDDFKLVNDGHGHDVGDKVLRRLAMVLGRELRKSDTCARWGGEEFLVLCPEAGEPEALLVAEKCRRAIAAELVAAGDGDVRISLSGGICVAEAGVDIDGLIRRADEALYAAKAAGKDRVMVWRAGA
jgi:diguanylate cyclase (GGDEF)-like protein